jgi:acyl carrier protein
MYQKEAIDLVKVVVVQTLGVQDRAGMLDAATPLLGSMPELDSMAVMELLLELERRFDIVVDDEDITADTFETLGSLTAFVERKLPGSSIEFDTASVAARSGG